MFLTDERSWSKTTSLLFLIAFTIVLIIPFANRAFNIDDPLFVWAAKHIQLYPGNPYGFKVNWYYAAMDASGIIKNPPLASYYMAWAASLFGWSEKALHLAFLVPAIGVVLGTYFLAQKFCDRPVLASVLGLVTPVFLVSSTTIMCDIAMLAFWVWAIVFWMKGMEADKHILFAISAIFITLCALTKYYGMNLILLLSVYAYAKKRSIASWMPYLLIPVIILSVYQHRTSVLYGRGLLLDAFAYAAEYQARSSLGFVSKSLIGLSFIGGCFLGLFFFLPFLWPRKVLLVQAVLLVIIATIIPMGKTWVSLFGDKFNIGYLQKMQFGLFVFVGLNALALSVSQAWGNKGNKESLLLFLWIIGTFIFAGFINWTVNARSLLPIAPAMGIILACRLDKYFKVSKKSPALFFPFIIAAFVAVCIAVSDYKLANVTRAAAQRICAKYGATPARLLFQGHWGFQYYMQAGGFQAVDIEKMRPTSGDIMVVPQNNTNIFRLPARMFDLRETMEFPACRWLTTMNSGLGAGFYSDIWGPLPFAIGAVPAERYDIFQAIQ